MRPTWRWRQLVLPLVGLLLIALLIALVEPSRVLAAMRGVHSRWVVLTMGLLIVATALGACNSYLMAGIQSRLRFLPFLAAYWVAWALGQLVPGQIGDVLGLGLYLRRHGVALSGSVGRLGLDKFISLFCVLLLAACLPLVAPGSLAAMLGMVASGGSAIVLGLGIYAVRRERFGDPATQGRWRGALTRVLAAAHTTATERPRAVVLNACVTTVKLGVIGASYAAMFAALGASPGGIATVTVMANSAGLVAYAPISANGLGTVEAAGIYLFGLNGVMAPTVLAAYLLLRAANLALACLGTALVLFYAGVRLRVPASTPEQEQ